MKMDHLILDLNQEYYDYIFNDLRRWISKLPKLIRQSIQKSYPKECNKLGTIIILYEMIRVILDRHGVLIFNDISEKRNPYEWSTYIKKFKELIDKNSDNYSADSENNNSDSSNTSKLCSLIYLVATKLSYKRHPIVILDIILFYMIRHEMDWNNGIYLCNTPEHITNIIKVVNNNTENSYSLPQLHELADYSIDVVKDLLGDKSKKIYKSDDYFHRIVIQTIYQLEEMFPLFDRALYRNFEYNFLRKVAGNMLGG